MFTLKMRCTCVVATKPKETSSATPKFPAQICTEMFYVKYVDKMNAWVFPVDLLST